MLSSCLPSVRKKEPNELRIQAEVLPNSYGAISFQPSIIPKFNFTRMAQDVLSVMYGKCDGLWWLTKKVANPLTSFILPLGGSFLTALGRMGIRPAQITTPSAMWQAISEQSDTEISLAILVGLCSQAINMLIMFLYLPRTAERIKTLLDTWRHPLRAEHSELGTQLLALAWSFVNALAMAYIFRITFLFTGYWFSFIPFGMYLFSNFATRYPKTNDAIYSYTRGNVNIRGKMFDKLYYYDSYIDDAVSVDDYLQKACDSLQNEDGRLRFNAYKYLYFQLTTWPGSIVACLLTIGSWPLLAVNAMKGFESIIDGLMHLVGASYQINGGFNSFGLIGGYLATVPSAYFYHYGSNRFLFYLVELLRQRAMACIPGVLPLPSNAEYFFQQSSLYTLKSQILSYPLIKLSLIALGLAVSVASGYGLYGVGVADYAMEYFSYCLLGTAFLVAPSSFGIAALVNFSSALELLYVHSNRIDQDELKEHKPIDHKTALRALIDTDVKVDKGVLEHEYFDRPSMFARSIRFFTPTQEFRNTVGHVAADVTKFCGATLMRCGG